MLPPTTPRLEPLTVEELDPSVRPQVEGFPAYNLFATMARHPALTRRFMRFGNHFLAHGALPPRDRELVILRTAWNADADYEWGHHAGLAQAVGVSADEVERVARAPADPAWDPFERTLLAAADELFQHRTLRDETWGGLATRYDQAQLLELPMLVGEYVMLSMFLRSVGVRPDPGTAPAPPR